MSSLVIYVISFVVIIGIVGTITTVFNNNIQDINLSSGTSSEYNKFNLYMLEQTQNGYSVLKYNNNESYVTFSNGETSNSFVLLGNILYFNKIKLCENVKEFKLEQTVAENGNDVLKTYININDRVYTTDYVIK